MKIIIFDGTFKTTTFIRRLLQGLVEAGHEVYVLGFNEANPLPVDDVNYVSLGSNNHNFSFLKTSLFWLMRSRSWRQYLMSLLKHDKKKLQLLNVCAALQKIQPDIVHLQWVSNINLFRQFLKNHQYNFVLSQRGFQTNVRPFVDKENFEYLQKWLPYFKGFHSVSEAISANGNQIYDHAEKIDQVVYTGLNLSQFKFAPNLKLNERFLIISVGRPHWIKGYDVAINAMSKLKAKNLNFKYQIIGGKGNEELLFLINDLGLTQHIELLDKMPQNQVFDLMHASDVFLLPSLEEGIANVAVEAMALGTPVISTNCGGMEELITHGHEGWIVPVYDVNALALQIQEFAKLEKRDVLKVVNFARAKVEIQHNEEQMVRGMLSMYQKVHNPQLNNSIEL